MTFLVGVELGFSDALRIIDTFTNYKQSENIEIKLNVTRLKKFSTDKSFQEWQPKLQES